MTHRFLIKVYRLLEAAAGEKLLLLLLLLYAALLIADPGLAYRTPGLVDVDALAAIAMFMTVSRGLELSGVFEHAAASLHTRAGSPRTLFMLFLAASGLSAALIMNDAALFIYIPLASALARETGVDRDRALILLTISINVGSALTPIGNPQNIIVWRHYHLGFHEIVCVMAPYTAISLLLVEAAALILLRGSHPAAEAGPGSPPRIRLDKRLLYASILLLAIDIVASETGHVLLGLAATLLAFLAVERSVLRGIDYALLAVFALMFIDFRELSLLLSPLPLLSLDKPYTVILAAALLSQAISNVPATIMLVNHTGNWAALMIGANTGGAGLATGSLANIITLRIARIRHRDFLKTSIPYYIASLMIFTALAYLNIYPYPGR